jgi:hypothetical protein
MGNVTNGVSVASAMLAIPLACHWGPGTSASADMMSLDATRHLWMARIEPRRRSQAASQIDRDGLVQDARVWLYLRGYLLPGRRILAEMAAAAQAYCLNALKDTIKGSVGAVMSDSWVAELTTPAPGSGGAGNGDTVFDWLRSASSGFGTRDMDDVRKRIEELHRLGAKRIDLPDQIGDGSGRLAIAHSKTEQLGEGALAWLSPETMGRLSAWLMASGITQGPVFRRINVLSTDAGAAGHQIVRHYIGQKALTRQGVVAILRRRPDRLCGRASPLLRSSRHDAQKRMARPVCK